MFPVLLSSVLIFEGLNNCDVCQLCFGNLQGTEKSVVKFDDRAELESENLVWKCSESDFQMVLRASLNYNMEKAAHSLVGRLWYW